MNLVVALRIQHWGVMLGGFGFREKILGRTTEIQALVNWLDDGFKYINLLEPCEWLNIKLCETGSREITGIPILTSGNLESGERETRQLTVTPLQPHQRAIRAGVPNPVQHGQSFDCHDHGNNSMTGALYGDILPAVEVIDAFPVNSKCMALPTGCFLQSCYGTAGIFLCNRSSENVNINCSYIAKIAKEIFTNYISRHQDQVVRLDFCRREKPPIDELERPLIDGPKGQEYTGNSFRKIEFATEGGDDMWSLQINRTWSCYEKQNAPREFEDGFIQLGSWGGLVYRA
ncbi:hypothetical protein TWF730_006062 [Orbilia blumenaviensis]|uniref:Uncharacterized protein n=1 Tax=Orbilia blumenaviensis TaxID=1796055 RepID=A0AAV9VN15_9PEZI